MTESQLSAYGSWASILGLVVAIVSLVYVRSIKKNIVRFRRKQRVRQLVDDILRIPDDATPLAAASLNKLNALKRNLPTYFWYKYTERGRATLEVHTHIDARDIVALKEAIND